MGSRKKKIGFQVDAVNNNGWGRSGTLDIPNMGSQCLLLHRIKVDPESWMAFRDSLGVVKPSTSFGVNQVKEMAEKTGALEIAAVDLETGVWLTVWAKEPAEVSHGFSEAQEAIREVRRQSAFLRQNDKNAVLNLVDTIIEETEQ